MPNPGTKIEVAEGNTLIHDWMGEKRMTTKGYEHWWKGGITPDALQYHFSWDWLMPVIEKIKSLRTDSFNTGGKYGIIVARLAGVNGIETVWESVVQFIQWHKTHFLNPQKNLKR